MLHATQLDTKHRRMANWRPQEHVNEESPALEYVLDKIAIAEFQRVDGKSYALNLVREYIKDSAREHINQIFDEQHNKNEPDNEDLPFLASLQNIYT